MKNIIKINLVILLLVTVVSCNKLNETDYSQLTTSGYKYAPSDVYSVIGPVYSNMRAMFGGAWNFSILQMATTDMLVMPSNASGWNDGGIYIQLEQHTWNAESPQVSATWNTLYTGVIHANRIIEQLNSGKVPAPSDANKKSLIAEMKVARAFYYWLLIDNFGDVPYVTTTSKKLPVATDRAVIYKAIVTDIKNAIPYLSTENNVLMYGRFNKWGAEALLANLYLNAKVYTGTAEWTKCLTVSNDIIASGKYSLNPNYEDDFTWNNQNSVETIFAIPYDPINGAGMYINCTLHAASKATFDLQDTPWGAGSMAAVPQFIDTYDTSDARLSDTWIHGPQFAADGVTPVYDTYDKAGQQLDYTNRMPNGIYVAENQGYRIIKFKPKMGANFYLSNDFPFFRYAQVLMMKAESLLRTGNAAEAAAIVTFVRQRDFKNNPSKATVTGAELMGNSKYKWGYVKNYKIVDPGNTTPVKYGGFYDQLGYEFACEWMRRRTMIRFGTYTTKSWLSHRPNGAYHKILPIPQNALDTNPNLKQNPGY